MLFLKAAVLITGIGLAFFIYPAKPTASIWKYKREIFINNPGSDATGAVFLIELNSRSFDYTKTKDGGADIRFSSSPNLKGPGLSYWIEQWNEHGVSKIWIKLPVLKAGNQNTLYLHYGNSASLPVSNGNDTFLFFDDFEDSVYTKRWTNISIGNVIVRNGILKLKEADGEDGILSADFNVTGKMIVRTLYQREGADQHWVRAGVGGWNNWLCFGDYTDWAGTGTNYLMMFDSNSITSLKSLPLVKAANTVITDKWRHVTYWYDGKTLKGMQDSVIAEWPMANASSKLALRTLDNDSWDNFAYISVSGYLDAEPFVTIGAEEKLKK